MVVHRRYHGLAYRLLSHLCETTPAGQPLFEGTTLMQYNMLFKWLNAACGVDGYSPHSPRAGFASEGFLAGRAFTELREDGRWLSDTSLRVYLDVVAVATDAASRDAEKWAPALHELISNFLDMFVFWPGCAFAGTKQPPALLRSALLAAMPAWPIPGKQGAAAHCLRQRVPPEPAIGGQAAAGAD